MANARCSGCSFGIHAAQHGAAALLADDGEVIAGHVDHHAVLDLDVGQGAELPGAEQRALGRGVQRFEVEHAVDVVDREAGDAGYQLGVDALFGLVVVLAGVHDRTPATDGDVTAQIDEVRLAGAGCGRRYRQQGADRHGAAQHLRHQHGERHAAGYAAILDEGIAVQQRVQPGKRWPALGRASGRPGSQASRDWTGTRDSSGCVGS